MPGAWRVQILLGIITCHVIASAAIGFAEGFASDDEKPT